MSNITEQQVLTSLSRVEDPDLHRDLVTLNMIKNLKIDGLNISFDIELTTPACPLKDKMKNDAVAAIKSDIPDVENITVNMTANVQSHIDSKKDALLPGVKNTIAVASGKGGVGKSTVAVNLAVALAKDGAKVGLLDADVYGPSIPLMLGISKKPKIYQDTNSSKMIPLENFGIKLMSIGFLVDENDPVIWRGPMASGAIKQFMSDVNWGDLDYLIYDLPPGTGDIQLTLVQTIPLTGAVIVTTPQDVALIDARKGLKMFERVNVPIMGIVENMSYFIAPDTGKKYDIFGLGGGQKLAKESNVPFLGEIPINAQIREGGDSGKPIIFNIPDSEYANKIMEIARNLAAQISITNYDKKDKKIEIVLNTDK